MGVQRKVVTMCGALDGLRGTRLSPSGGNLLSNTISSLFVSPPASCSPPPSLTTKLQHFIGPGMPTNFVRKNQIQGPLARGVDTDWLRMRDYPSSLTTTRKNKREDASGHTALDFIL